MSSSAQYLSIIGAGLSSSVIIDAPDGFEISTFSNKNFTSRPLTIRAIANSVNDVVIYVRASPTQLGNVSGTIHVSSIGSNSANVNVHCVGIGWNVPSNYYSGASGLVGASLKTALYNKILGHSVISYANLWQYYSLTDVFYNGYLWDIYSTSISPPFASYSYPLITSQCGNYTGKEGDCYVREHSFPQSWFASASPMVSDMFIIYPTDAKVNGIRTNDPYGEVAISTTNNTPTQNGSKSGLNSFAFSGGFTGKVFEPIDEYKGDLARGYFYMATRYENVIANWASNSNASVLLDSNSFPVFKPWELALLIKWHNQDPVSMKEINRNNAIYGIQGNRNPYIDSPQFVQRIWGGAMPSKPLNTPQNLTQIQNVSGSTMSIDLFWKNGDGYRRIVVGSYYGKIKSAPRDSIEYNASGMFGQGDQVAPNDFVVYNGTGSSVTVTNCNPNNTYYFKVYEYNGYKQTCTYLVPPNNACQCN
jgi:endonuclease I